MILRLAKRIDSILTVRNIIYIFFLLLFTAVAAEVLARVYLGVVLKKSTARKSLARIIPAISQLPISS